MAPILQPRLRPDLPRTEGRITMTKTTAQNLSAAWLTAALAAQPAAAAAFATKEEAVAMVKRAVAFIQAEGPEKAYPEFTRKAGRFHDRDLYITVLGLDGAVLAHGQREDFVGRNLMEATDPDGKFFVKERSELARRSASFWQTYKFMNPTSKTVELKDMYCERLGETNVCGGVYAL